MAIPADIEQIKKITNGAEGYTDEDLGEMLDNGKTIREIAYQLWQEAAASYSTLVNVSESGSSRSLGDLHKNALAMAAQYAPQFESDIPAPKRTRKMVRG